MCVACAAAAVAAHPARSEAIFPAEARPWPWPDGRAAAGLFTWTGVAGFVFESAGTRIALDPFATRPSLFATLFRRARPDDEAVAAAFGRLDAVFVGHTHFDHAMDLPAVARTSPSARIHGSRTTVEACRRLGVAQERLALARDGTPVEVGPFRVVPVRAEHGVVPLVRLVDRRDLPEEGVPATPFRWPRGDVLAYRVEVAGRSFHVQGSAGIVEESLARQRPADVLIACLAARRGTPRYLERLAQRLRPAFLVPCHHDDFFRPLDRPPRPIATLRWRSFLEEAEAMRRAHGTRLVLPVRGRPVPF